jgi:hypothetical protein
VLWDGAGRGFGTVDLNQERQDERRKVMPYIEQRKRRLYDPPVNELIKVLLDAPGWGKCYTTPGDFNYCITRLILALWDFCPTYSKANELIGVLECVKQEFYQRHLAPYEDAKMAENGDVE